ncbi:MAG: hypothetical protein P4K93_07400 [Terracidiphilus sp.]|nr:hypothetical protein [Terracidiphilus sp.]
MASIELATSRIVVIEDRGKQYRLTLARILKKQWMHYFDGVVSASENQFGKRVDSFDSTSARLALVEQSLVNAEGYATADGSPVTSAAGWQSLLPLSHRLAVGNAIVNVERAEPSDDEPIVLGVESVYLNALWSADDKGVMQKYRNLCHRFKTPNADQQRRFSRDSSRSRIIGGSRKAKTLWLGPQPTLVELYDELIVSVDGYQANGAELGADREAIVAEMDAYHKVAAADVLFSPAAANLSEDND